MSRDAKIEKKPRTPKPEKGGAVREVADALTYAREIIADRIEQAFSGVLPLK